MKLHTLKISGFKRLKDVTINFGDATFLIGQNNCGKSTILKAIEILLSAKKQLTNFDYHSIIDEETGETKVDIQTIVLEAEFRNLPEEAKQWRGFKGRIFEYDIEEEEEVVDSGLSVTYKKTYEIGKDVMIEFKSKVREIAEDFRDCKTINDFIAKGLSEELFSILSIENDKPIGKSKGILEKLEQIDEIWDIQDDEVWFQNPGGIPGNVLKMLPRFLMIPVDISTSEIQGNGNGVLGKTLGELFETVRENSNNFKEAQTHLQNLAKELDPQDVDSEFGKMMTDLNMVLESVFPDTKLHATTNLSDPTSLKPSFNVEMSSNIKTIVEYQGTGMIRAAVFGMLRYRQKWLSQREDDHARSLIICFEEPEIYLHPSAANQMREAIYDLSTSNSQIIASTHSPYLIDISKKPKQVLNRLYNCGNHVNCNSFSVSEKFKLLQDDDKDYVKMLMKIDNYISRIFFTNTVIVIEGDTEDLLIRESLKRLPRQDYLKILSNFEIVKARGKAAIIGLIKYLASMGIQPIVVHDRDANVANAEKYNKPIQDALGDGGKIIMMHENVEDELNYAATYEKPLKAYIKTKEWGENWDDLPENWRIKLKEIFGEYIP
ncbi:AAA family ATPase [Flavobacterium sp. LHD-80]|uniref:AAA family ATPase n=1 Tax=Flavobacterium sp. LHD-80 TaxID=3071411 RepID=UPI0027E007F6|nr:AAA family ATPase [Flavobacterium sp. LHD-80]MDQ6470873.1 AAA family ATPase [Flavobacterium sp. LHD-80]